MFCVPVVCYVFLRHRSWISVCVLYPEPELQGAQEEVEQLRQEVEKLKKCGKKIFTLHLRLLLKKIYSFVEHFQRTAFQNVKGTAQYRFRLFQKYDWLTVTDVETVTPIVWRVKCPFVPPIDVVELRKAKELNDRLDQEIRALRTRVRTMDAERKTLLETVICHSWIQLSPLLKLS